jgi:hypothetical protein
MDEQIARLQFLTRLCNALEWPHQTKTPRRFEKRYGYWMVQIDGQWYPVI